MPETIVGRVSDIIGGTPVIRLENLSPAEALPFWPKWNISIRVAV